MREHDRLRAKVYGLLEGERRLAGTKLLARTVAENPDAKGLVVLIDLRHMRGRIPWIAIERVLTERVPAEDQVGTFEVLPVPAGEVRRQLLARTTDGGPDDICARYLDEVDRFRDELGTPESGAATSRSRVREGVANTRGEEGFLDVAVALEVVYRLRRSGRNAGMPDTGSD